MSRLLIAVRVPLISPHRIDGDILIEFLWGHYQRVTTGLGSRRVVAQFDGGTLTSDAGALLLRDLDGRTGIMDGFAECFTDHRHSSYCDHGVRQMFAQRVYGICLGYEDLNDHEQLRYDPLFAALCGEEDVSGSRRRQIADVGKALAGKSTLHRLETAWSARESIPEDLL